MGKEKTPNYTEANEARIREVAEENGTLNGELAAELADEMGKTTRSVIAKIIRMGLPYANKQPTSKDGSPVQSKADLVASIGEVVDGNLDGLEKAPKVALRALADFVASANG